MSGYLIYGKRTEPVRDKNTGKIYGPDSRFCALDWGGKRVARKTDAFEYATKEDAQERIDKMGGKPGVIFEIRKS